MTGTFSMSLEANLTAIDVFNMTQAQPIRKDAYRKSHTDTVASFKTCVLRTTGVHLHSTAQGKAIYIMFRIKLKMFEIAIRFKIKVIMQSSRCTDLAVLRLVCHS